MLKLTAKVDLPPGTFIRAMRDMLDFPEVHWGIHSDHPQWLDEDGRPRSEDPVEVAAFHEFGVGNLPRRPFIEKTGELLAVEYGQELAAYIDREQDPDRLPVHQIQSELTRIGIQALESKKIPLAPNKPSTVAKKYGRNSPMIDTGNLVRMLDAKVVRKP